VPARGVKISCGSSGLDKAEVVGLLFGLGSIDDNKEELKMKNLTEEEKHRLSFVVSEMERLRSERDALVVKHYQEGADYNEMASAMGKTRNAVALMIRNLRRAGVAVGPVRKPSGRKRSADLTS
jgi:hypothetical protein